MEWWRSDGSFYFKEMYLLIFIFAWSPVCTPKILCICNKRVVQILLCTNVDVMRYIFPINKTQYFFIVFCSFVLIFFIIFPMFFDLIFIHQFVDKYWSCLRAVPNTLASSQKATTHSHSEVPLTLLVAWHWMCVSWRGDRA